MKINSRNVNVVVTNENVDNDDNENILIDKNKAKTVNKTVINEAVPLENVVVVSGNIYAGNIIKGDVVEIDCGKVIKG